jgi:hypothetical protein
MKKYMIFLLEVYNFSPRKMVAICTHIIKLGITVGTFVCVQFNVFLYTQSIQHFSMIFPISFPIQLSSRDLTKIPIIITNYPHKNIEP